MNLEGGGVRFMKHKSSTIDGSKVGLLQVIFLFLFAFTGNLFAAGDMQAIEFGDNMDPVGSNGEFVYMVKLKNNTPETADNAILSVTIPEGFTFVGVDSTDCSYTGDTPSDSNDSDKVECTFATFPGSTEMDINITVRAPSVTMATVFESTAYATCDSDANTANDEEIAKTTIVKGADLNVTKTGSPNPVVAGGIVTYEFKVANKGPNTADAVRLTDALPGGLEFYADNNASPAAEDAAWSCTDSAGTVTCNGGDLVAGESATFYFRAKVSQSSVGGNIVNTAQIESDTQETNNTDNVDDDTLSLLPGTDMGISKYIDTSPAISEQNVTFTLSVTNHGPEDAKDVNITDILPSNYTNVTASAAGWTCDVSGNPTIMCTRDDDTMPADTTETITITAQTRHVDAVVVHQNSATVATSTADPITDNDSDTVNYELFPDQADLWISKSKGPSPIAVGDTATSEIRLGNHGPRAATPVQVVDVLSDSESYESYSGTDWSCTHTGANGDGTGGRVTCDYAQTLAMGDETTTLDILTTASDEGDINNTACTGGSGGSDEPDAIDKNTDNDCVGAGVSGTDPDGIGVADLRVIKISDDSFIDVNENNFSYVINIKNTDESIEGNISQEVEFRDTIPQYVSAFGGRPATTLTATTDKVDANCSISAAVVVCQLGDIALNEEVNVTIIVERPMADGNRTNTASAYSQVTGDPIRSNNEDNTSVEVAPMADIQLLSKTVTPNDALAGTEAVYTIQVQNRGPSIARDVNVTDIMSGKPFTMISKPPYCDYNETTTSLQCALGDMSNGATRSISITIRPDHLVPAPTDSWEINNTATVTGSTYDPEPNNNEKNVTLFVHEGQVDLVIEKNESPIFHEPVSFDPENLSNNLLVYQIDIQNLGPSLATGIHFLDRVVSVSPDVDQNLTFVRDTSHPDGSDDGTAWCVPPATNPFTPDAAAPVIDCNVSELAAGDSLVRYLVFHVDNAPHYVFGDVYKDEINITSREIETLSGNNEESEKTTVRVQTDVQMKKTAPVAPVEVGESFTYVLTVTNHGPGYSPSTDITDSLPTGMVLTGTPTASPQGSCIESVGDTSFTCNVDESDGTLHSKYLDSAQVDEVNITVPVMVVTWTGAMLTNTASVSTTGPDSNESNNVDSADITVLEPAHVGDRIWHDLDADGIQDADESGIANVTVELLYDSNGSVAQTTVTNSSGIYNFDINHSTDYRVHIDLTDPDLSGYRITTENNTNTTDLLDSDINASGETGADHIDHGETNTTFDAGFFKVASIGDRVWIDDNGDGLLNIGEVGVPDVNVTLYDENNVQVTVDIDGAVFGTGGIIETNATGYYLFDNLRPGKYHVHFDKATLPAEYVFTHIGAGGANADNSDPDRETGITNEITVISDQNDMKWDAGIFIPVSIGDHVWHDINGDGIQDANESGLPNVEVTLYNSTCGTVITQDQNGSAAFSGTITTDANGSYLFENLAPKGYCLGFSSPTNSGYVLTRTDQGTDNNDSDVYGTGLTAGKTNGYILTSGEDNVSVDAGFYIEIKLGDRVWEDENYNGIQDATEANVSGVRARLIIDGVLQDGTGGTTDRFRDTNSSGEYLFDDLVPGYRYSVQFSNLPTDYRFTQQDVASATDDTDSDANATGYASGETPVEVSMDVNVSFDAGIYKPVVIGDRVWEDMDADGVQDAGEPGIQGVTVTLVIDGVVTAITDTTDSSGDYLFDTSYDLKPDHTYSVQFSDPPSPDKPYHITTQDAGSDDTIDSDIAALDIPVQETPRMYSDEENLTLDAGFYRNASMGDRIWLDTNGNGIQDAGESGVAGVTIRLYDASNTLQDTNTTDANGLYQFDDLRPGSYYIIVDQTTLPAGGYVFTQKDAGTNNDIDSDVNGTGVSTVVVLTSNEDNSSTDAGIYIPVSIGDHAWVDEDGDGLQDAGEQNLTGVRVQLYRTVDDTEVTTDLNGTAFGTVTTDANGAYLFDNLRPDDYYVRFTAPNATDYVITLQTQGADGSIDSDPNGVATATGITGSYTLSSDEDNMSVDAGFYEPIEIGDRVWIDRDYNGIQDAGEQNLSGVDVTLYQDSTVYGAPTVTDANGAYLFDALPQGHTYSVEFNLSNVNTNNGTDYRFTQQDQGNDATDSDADMITGRTASTAFMRSGDSDMTLDAGVYEPVTIGDKVWLDDDGDGMQDATEAGISGVLVTLIIDGVEHTEINATTNATGDYLFDHSYDLKPDHTYSVHFSNPDASYLFTQANAGSSDSNDSDANATGYSTEVTPTMYTGEQNLTLDAGMHQLASIGDRIWLDTNADGIQDAGEQNLTGVSVDVALFTEDGTQVGATQTVSNGSYLFTGVVPGNYYVTFTLPNGYRLSPENATADSMDSDVNASLRTETTLLSSGENDLDWDMGVYQPASIGDRIWLDTNADGIQDATEGDLNGVDVNVTLYDSNDLQIGAVVETNTGAYSFTDLVPGSYYVTFTLPNGYVVSPQDSTDEAHDSDVDSGTLRTATTTLVSGENNSTWDLGLYQNATIGDRIWLDANADGIQDATEQNVTQSVTVTLLDDANSTVATQTVTNGSYLFTDVTPGAYHLRFSLPAGYVVSPQDAIGSDENNDSDVNDTTMETISTVLISGENELHWDLGLYQPASIGDRIWLDENGDGIQNGSEGNFTGSVTVYLEDENNASVIDASGNSVVSITTNTGAYHFTDLVPGTYHMRFVFPSGAQLSAIHAGTSSTDSDVIADSNTTEDTVLISGEDDTSWDAGLFMYAGVGDLVWIDTNGNGIQDDAQVLDTNVTVNLYYDGNGSLADTQTVLAGSNGLYSFVDVDPDDYYVEFVLPMGSPYRFIAPNAGGDDTIDSDADVSTGRTATESITSNETNNTLDAGIYIPASIGDRVWFDANANGIQESNEGNISDINVTLYDAGGTAVATVTTDENGSYLFDGLVPGDYTISVALTDAHGQAYTVTPQVGSQADSNNSDINAAGTSATITVVSGEEQQDIDAGLYIPVDIGDRVWSDSDGDGVQDASESGISDVNVTLYRVESDGTISTVGSQNTTATGAYLFASLIPGEYYLHVEQPEHYRTTLQDSGTDDGLDSDIDTVSGDTDRFILTSPDDNLTLDAGFYALATISGHVSEDTNNDDIGDTDLSGVTITLYDDQGTQVQQTTTDGNGDYSFIDVEPGNYTVVETQPDAMVNVSENEGGADNDTGNTTLDNIIAVTVGIGEVDTGNDFVDELGVYIGDRIWMDRNGDGIQDASEDNVTVLEDISVNLYRDGAYVATTTTDDQGYYLFANYPDGNYSVEFNLTTLPAHYGVTMQDQGSDDSNDSDVNETTYATMENETAMSIEVTLLPGDHNLTMDMGIYRLGTVSGTVRVDMDGDDDTHGANDDVMEGVQMDLIDENGEVVATVYTDSNGEYQFIDVPQGTYTIREHQPDGYLDLNATSGDVQNDDVNEITVVVGAEEDDTQNDFDDKLGGKIGDYVWNDTDEEHGANGIQDENETGVNGVHVCLEDDQGNAIIDPKSGEQRCTDTNATGYYEFVGLIPGSYLVVFEIPNGTALTPEPLAGDDRTVDSNPIETIEVNGTDFAKAPIEIGIGTQDESIDMGLVYLETASIGNYVWNDANRNGIQDPGEEGLDGVHIILYDSDGVKLEEYITRDGGYYRFEHLTERYYTLEVVLADGYVITNQDIDDDVADSDVDPDTRRTIAIDLKEGQYQGGWDIGLYCGCDMVESDSADSMSLFSLLSMLFMTGLMGMLLMRRREKN